MDDRLISNTYENWSFGADYSGEIISQENIDSFITKCQGMGEIHLATATDSRGNNPVNKENKEQNVFDCHFAGLVMAMKALSKGGNLIWFSYSLYNAVNISLIYFLNIVFEEVHISKPAGCAMACFEFYIIGLHFKKDVNVEKYIDLMKSTVGLNSWEKGNYLILC